MLPFTDYAWTSPYGLDRIVVPQSLAGLVAVMFTLWTAKVA